MECDDEEGDRDCEIECEALKVIDNLKSCSGGDGDGENERTERVASRLRKLIQCMQE